MTRRNSLLDAWFGLPDVTWREYDIYNPEEYELVPRKSYKEKQVQAKEEELRRLKEAQKHYNSRADAEILRVTNEIEKLRSELSG
jgi:hypothetical protein